MDTLHRSKKIQRRSGRCAAGSHVHGRWRRVDLDSRYACVLQCRIDEHEPAHA
jgi:hypothetical protein